MKPYFLFMDTESGGIDPSFSLLSLCLYVVDPESLELVDKLTLFLKYDRYIVCAKALEINKLDLVRVEESGVTTKDATQILNQFLKKHVEKVRSDLGRPAMRAEDVEVTPLVPVGHNIAFDTVFLKTSLPGVKWDKYVSYRVLDTQVIARYLQMVGKLPPYLKCSLRSLATFFGVEDNAAHTAEGDVIVTLEVFKSLLKVVN